MARKERAEVEGGLYHVITRGNNRRQIFNSPADYEKFLSLLGGPNTSSLWNGWRELLAEYAPSAAVTSPQKEYGYRNGQLLVTATVPVTVGTGLQAHISTT